MNNKQESKGEYIPGTCNIGREEIIRRRAGAIIGLIITIIFIVIMQWFKIDHWWRLLIFLPVTSTVISFEQWYFKFCVAFARMGVYNFGPIGKTYKVENTEYLKKDRAKARRMNLAGILAGAVAAVVYFFLPV